MSVKYLLYHILNQLYLIMIYILSISYAIYNILLSLYTATSYSFLRISLFNIKRFIVNLLFKLTINLNLYFYGIIIVAPGPNRNPNTYQTINKSDHPINNEIEYGSIVDIKVPAPVSSSYFSAKATINAK